MTAIVVEDLLQLPLEESQPVIYDRPIGLRLLHQDPHSGAEHYLVRYPPGLRAQRHTHTAAHTALILSGAMAVDGALIGPGSYVHFPAGEPMYHEPAPGMECLFVLIFDGPFDVQPVAPRG